MLEHARLGETARRRVTLLAAAAALLVPAVAVVGSAASAPNDAREVAFVRFDAHSGRLRIFTTRLSGGPAKPVALPVPNAQSPVWSPDGRLLAFVGGSGASEARNVSGEIDLYVAAPDGSRARRLTHGAAPEAAPAWAPDGKRLAFVRPAPTGNRSSLWLVGADGRGAHRLTFGNTDLEPAWSPRGDRIVFVRITPRFESGIWEIRPDGSGLRRFLPGLQGATDPVWSPDGSRLLLSDGRTLFTIRPDGGGRRTVTRLMSDANGGREDPQPAWSPGGSIVFCQLRPGVLQRSDLWVVSPSGSRLRRLTLSPTLDTDPSARP